MKKALILRGGKALGDMLFISWVPKYLKRKLDFDKVYVATWDSTRFIFDNNPFVDGIISLDEIGNQNFQETMEKWDKEFTVYDFRYSVEQKYLLFNNKKVPGVLERRERARCIHWHNCYGNLDGGKPDVYLSDAEKKRNKDFPKKTRILWQPIGSGRNKMLRFIAWYIQQIQDRFPDVEHWIAGTDKQPIPLENVNDVRGKWSAREALTMVPIFDLVIGPESFFINAARAFDVKTVTFYSHSAPENLKYKYDFPIVPTCDCSPCYLIQKDFRNMYDLEERALARKQENHCIKRDDTDPYKVLGYRCCTELDHKNVILTIKKALGR